MNRGDAVAGSSGKAVVKVVNDSNKRPVMNPSFVLSIPDQRAIEAIESLGGTTDYVNGVVRGFYAPRGVTDAGVEHLTVLTSLEILDLSDTQITDAGLAATKAALLDCYVLGP